jgi:hypothetical protein
MVAELVAVLYASFAELLAWTAAAVLAFYISALLVSLIVNVFSPREFDIRS